MSLGKNWALLSRCRMITSMHLVIREKFGKQVGGDILANKKTFLLIHAFETATPAQQKELKAFDEPITHPIK